MLHGNYNYSHELCDEGDYNDNGIKEVEGSLSAVSDFKGVASHKRFCITCVIEKYKLICVSCSVCVSLLANVKKYIYIFLRRTYWPWTPWGQGQAGTLWSCGNGQSHQPRRSHDQCPWHHDCGDCRSFSYVQLWRLHPQGKHNIWYVMIPIWTGCSEYIKVFLIICLHFCITHPQVWPHW